MINERLLKIRNQKKDGLKDGIDKKMCEVKEIHKREGRSPSWRKALTELNDMQAYEFSYLRTWRSRRDNSGSPSTAAYWIDFPRDENELTQSAILEKLESVDADDLRKIIADIILFNHSLRDSAIDMIEAWQKDNGKIKVNSEGKLAKTKDLQNYFRYLPNDNREYHSGSKRRAIANSLNQILIFSETRQADSMEKSAAPQIGAKRTKKPETLKKELKTWITKQWDGSLWSSQDEFITKMRSVAPQEKGETLEGTSDEEIKGWLFKKKKK